jgi:hypothetical protein
MKAFLVLLALVLLAALAAHFLGVGREPTPFDLTYSADDEERRRGIDEFPVDLVRGERRPEVIATVRRLLADPHMAVRLDAAKFAGRAGLVEVIPEIEAVAKVENMTEDQMRSFRGWIVRDALAKLRAPR